MVANDQNNRNANALAQALANERAGQKAEQIQNRPPPPPQNLPPNTDKTLQPINPLNPTGSSFGDRPFGTQAQRNAQIGNSIYSDLINSGLTPGSPVFNQQLDRRLGGNNLQLNPDNRANLISMREKSDVIGSQISNLLGGFGQGQQPQAQPQPAPSLLISGENPDAKLQPTSKNFDSYFGVDVSNVSGISTGLTSGKNVSQSQLDQAAKEAAAKAEYQNGPNYFGSSGFIAQGPEANKRAIANPSGGFSFVPNAKGPTSSTDIFGISPTVTPAKSVSQSAAPVSQAPIPFLDVSGLDSKTINGVNDFVSKAASQKGVTDIKLSYSVTPNITEIKSYPLNSALGGIITDLNSVAKSNPNQKISIGLSAAGVTTQTIRPPKEQTQKERTDLLNFISNAGGKPITIKDQNGNVIKTTSGQRARFDIIKEAEKQPIKMEFSNVVSTKPPFDAKTGQVLKPLGEYTDKELLAKGLSQNEINNIRSPSFFTEFFKAGKARQENIFGPPQAQQKEPLNDIFGGIYSAVTSPTPIPFSTMQKDIGSTGELIAKNPARFAGSLFEELGFNLATLGTGKIAEGGAEVSRVISQAGRVKNIINGPLRDIEEKVSVEQGIAKTSLKIDKINNQIADLNQQIENKLKPTISESILGTTQATKESIIRETQPLIDQRTNLENQAKELGQVNSNLGNLAKIAPGTTVAKTITPVIEQTKRYGNGVYGLFFKDIKSPYAGAILNLAKNDAYTLTPIFQNIPEGTKAIPNAELMSGVRGVIRTSLAETSGLSNLDQISRVTENVNNFFQDKNLPYEVTYPTRGSELSGFLSLGQNLNERVNYLAQILTPRPTVYAVGTELPSSEINNFLTNEKSPDLLSKVLIGKEKPDLLNYISSGTIDFTKPNLETIPKNINALKQPLETREFLFGLGVKEKPYTKGFNYLASRFGEKGNTIIKNFSAKASKFNLFTGETKVGAGGAGRAKSYAKAVQNEKDKTILEQMMKEPNANKPLTKSEKEALIRNVSSRYTKESIKSPTLLFPPTNYLGQGKQNERKNGRSTSETEYTTLQYPQGTKEKNAFSFISGFGSVTIQKPALSIIPDFTSTSKQNLKQIETPGILVGRTPKLNIAQTPLLTPALFTSQITPQQTRQTESQNYITGQITQQQTPSIFSTTFEITPPPEKPTIPTIPTGFIPPFEFPGFSFNLPKRLPPGKRKYILYGTNPFVVGEFYTPGLAEQSVSSSPSIFTTGETTIRKANRGKILSGYASFTGNVHVVNPRKKPSGVKSIFSPGPTQTRPKGKKGKQPTSYFF